VAADEDTVRDVIHAFNQRELAALDRRWAGGRPRRISDDDVAFIVATAKTCPGKLGCPFTHWSVRKLAGYLRRNDQRVVRLGRERLQQILHEPKDQLSADPHLEGVHRPGQEPKARPDRGGHPPIPGPVLRLRPVRPAVHPALPWHHQGPESKPTRLPATYHRTYGIRCFHGCYSLGDDRLWGRRPAPQGRRPHPRRAKSIRAARSDGAPTCVILDNLSANKIPAIRAWAARHKVDLCFTPTTASWANPIEAQFGPLRPFTMSASNHPNHPALARKLQDYLRWRNSNARHPDVLAAQRRERARIRSERQQRWGRPRECPFNGGSGLGMG
jgi:hypothetical protein